jgi:hypothetical protein
MITAADINFSITTEPDAYEGHVLLTTIADTIRAYVVMTREQAITLALWVVHTHAIEGAEFTPYIGIRSAAKRSGKTTLLEVLAQLVARPWLTGRISAAVLVRKTDRNARRCCSMNQTRCSTAKRNTPKRSGAS